MMSSSMYTQDHKGREALWAEIEAGAVTLGMVSPGAMMTLTPAQCRYVAQFLYTAANRLEGVDTDPTPD